MLYINHDYGIGSSYKPNFSIPKFPAMFSVTAYVAAKTTIAAPTGKYDLLAGYSNYATLNAWYFGISSSQGLDNNKIVNSNGYTTYGLTLASPGYGVGIGQNYTTPLFTW